MEEEAMCTAVSYQTKSHYFGRNLDWDYSFHEKIIITPRNVPLWFRRKEKMEKHYAMIGMGLVMEDTPMYFDAVNEKGVGIAGLNFPGNADYKEVMEHKDNIAPYELIPWLLGQCASIAEVRKKLATICLAAIPFSDEVPLAPLHWMICDKKESLVVECVREGLNVYENPVGVLANNPVFEQQLHSLNRYMQVSSKEPENRFSEKLDLKTYSRGMGGIGLPGDWSSESRFVRAAFARMNVVCGDSESESVSQFFHILGSVSHFRGCVQTEQGGYEYTVYSSCCNTDKGIYYYTTYENSSITGVDMHAEDLEGDTLIEHSLVRNPPVTIQNISI